MHPSPGCGGAVEWRPLPQLHIEQLLKTKLSSLYIRRTWDGKVQSRTFGKFPFVLKKIPFVHKCIFVACVFTPLYVLLENSGRVHHTATSDSS